MLEWENSDLWQIMYDEYDKPLVEPELYKHKTQIEATQAIFRKSSIRHILANEAADAAADQATDGFGKLIQELKTTNKEDQQAFDLHKRVCRRLAAIEHHIREKWGPVTVE